jgi:hypothetical protein
VGKKRRNVLVVAEWDETKEGKEGQQLKEKEEGEQEIEAEEVEVIDGCPQRC